MCKKILFTSLILSGFVLFGMAEIFFADAPAELEQAKSNIISLVKEGNYAEAEVQMQKLIAGFPKDTKMAKAIHDIAQQYQETKQFDKAVELSQYVLDNWPRTEHSVWLQMRLAVCSIIRGDDYTAQQAISRLSSEYADDPNLPMTLYILAEQYRLSWRFEEAKNLYQLIIQQHTDSSYANKAKLGFANADVTFLVVSQNYNDAEYALDKLVADFNDNPDLPEALYGISDKYEWLNRYEQAKRIYQQIIQHRPDSSYASKAKLGIPRAEVMSLIVSQNYDRAREALDKLVTDFAGHPDLPGTLYWIAEEYKWSERFGDAKSIYQKIIRSYPDSSFADKSRLGIARAEVTSLISSQNYDQAREAIGKMISDFNDHPDLPETLYWIADAYKWSDRYEDADNIYRQVIQKTPPDSSYASKAKLGLSSADVASIIASEDFNQANSAVDDLVADFNDHPDLPSAISMMGEKYYNQALCCEKEGRDTEAKEYFRKAITAWKRITEEFPPSAEYTPQAYHRMAYCCFERLGEYEKAIEYCKKVIDNWPNYEYASEVQFSIGNYYERLIYSGLIPESEANHKIEQAYQAVVEKYPDSSNFKYASLKVAELNFKKGQWTKAAMYFELLLEKYPENQRPSSILYQLGRAYEEMGEFDLAEQLYREFIKLSYPTDPHIEDVRARIERFKAAASARNILTDVEMGSLHGGCSICVDNGEACDPPHWGSCSESCSGVFTSGCIQAKKTCTGYPLPVGKCVPITIGCEGTNLRTECSWDLVDEVCSSTTIRVSCLGTKPSCYEE